MDDNNQVPAPAQDDDLLGWMPPELVERARAYEERDAGAGQPKGKRERMSFTAPPGGRHRALSLAALAGGAMLLLLGTLLSATGARGAQALLEKGRLWFALWLAGQAATLCVYLLCLLPLGQKPRRPALAAALGAGLAFALAASVTTMAPRGGDSLPFRIISIFFALLLAMAFSPNSWLLLGLLRRRSSERFSALMGSVNLAISLFGLTAALAKGKTDASAPITALGLVQGLCYLCLVASWPILDRAVLSKPEGATDGQPE
jgi:hypothetical protein